MVSFTYRPHLNFPRERVISQQMARHLEVNRYGDFVLTEAVRPGLELRIVPRQAYRLGLYRDPEADLRVPVLTAAVSREGLFDTFLSLLEPLGQIVNAVLETSHQGRGLTHRDLYRHDVDLPVLASYLCDFEELLLDDGCTGVAIISADQPVEVQFDEHKLLTIYAADLRPFERILRANGVMRDDGLRLISEDDHLHTSRPQYAEQFQQLACRLGVGESVEHVSW